MPHTIHNATPSIHSLLPYKEGFTTSDAGAVALVVSDGFMGSAYAKTAIVFGRRQKADSPAISAIPYQALKPRLPLFGGPYIGLPRSYLHHINQETHPPDLLEVHGRSYVASYLAKKQASKPQPTHFPMVLYLHNDPRQMKGSESVRQRRWLLGNLAGIFCVSDYVRRCFLDGLGGVPSELSDKLVVIPNAAQRVWDTLPVKENLITVIGRMVKEKGMAEAAQALVEVLPEFPDWRVAFIGSSWFGTRQPTEYEKQIAHILSPLTDAGQADITGYLPHSQVRDWQARSAIVLAPSKWHEPAPKTVIEALAAGAAVITSRRGGIPEYAKGRAFLLNRPHAKDIVYALRRLIGDANTRKRLQQKAWHDYPFTIANMVKKLDAARKNVLERIPKKNQNPQRL